MPRPRRPRSPALIASFCCAGGEVDLPAESALFTFAAVFFESHLRQPIRRIRPARLQFHAPQRNDGGILSRRSIAKSSTDVTYESRPPLRQHDAL